MLSEDIGGLALLMSLMSLLEILTSSVEKISSWFCVLVHVSIWLSVTEPRFDLGPISKSETRKRLHDCNWKYSSGTCKYESTQDE